MKNDESDLPNPARVLVLAFDGIEEIEALAPVDLLRRANVETILASCGEQTLVHGRNEIRFQCDCSLASIDPTSFDVLFIPGGPGVLNLLQNEVILDLLRNHEKSGKWTAALCAAPKLLAAAGLLENRSATGHISIRSELPHPSDERVVLSDRVLTSQGAGTAIEFGLALIALLTDRENAAEVGASIHA